MDLDNAQLRRNLYWNVASLIVNIIIGLLYTPYLVRILGISAYGLVPLALIINQYIGVITDALTSSLTRFYMISIQKRKWKSASKYLSSSFFLIIGIILFLCVPAFFFIYGLNGIFNIPEEFLTSAKYLFSFTLLSFFCSLVSSIFNIILFTLNRLDFLNIIKIIRGALKPILVFVFFSTIEVNLSYIGLANFLGELIILGCSYIFYMRFTYPEIKLSTHNFNKNALYSVLAMSLWVIIQSLGDIGIYRIDVVILNIFWSTKESGIIGSFSELGTYLYIISALFISLFGPLILKAYSKGEHEKVKELTLDNSLIIGIVTAVMIGILIGFSNFVLSFWLGDNFTNYSKWFTIKMLLLPFFASAGFFVTVIRSWNKVKFPAIITVLLGIINFFIVHTIAENSENSENSIDIILMISLLFGIAQSYFLNGLYFSYIYKKTFKTIIINFIKTTSALLIVSVVSTIISLYLSEYSLTLNIISVIILSVILLSLSLFTFLNKRQMKNLLQIVIRNK